MDVTTDDDLDFEEERGYMKDKKLIKRDPARHQPVDHHMEDDHPDLLSATTTTTTVVDDDTKKKKATSANVGGGSGFRRGPAGTTGSTSAGAGGGGGSSSMKCCQADKCNADLTDAKQYHRRHKVCEHHAKAQVVIVGGIRQRFCQQCSRFHELSEFDEAKRSCRRRLAGHNERRRKSSAETQTEGSGSKGTQMKDIVCGQVDDRGSRIHLNIQENTSYKHYQIR